MKKCLLMLLFLFQITVISKAQSFEYIYSTPEDEYVHDIIQDSQNNYYLVGIKGTFTGSYTYSGYSSFIIKLDSIGDTLKTLIIPPSNDIAQLNEVVKLSDSTFAGIGLKNSLGSASGQIWYLKFDTALNILDEKLIGDTTLNSYPKHSHKTQQNELLLAGTGGVNADYQGMIYKLTLDGDTLQSFYLGDTLPQAGYDVLQLHDTSGYLLFGWNFNHTSTGGGEIIKINNYGIIDTIVEMTCSFNTGMNALWLSDSTFATATSLVCFPFSNSYDFRFQIFDLNLNMLADTLIGDADTNEIILQQQRGLDFINPGSIFVAGTKNWNYTDWEHDVAYFDLIKFNSSLQPHWEKLIAHNNDYLLLKSVRATNDGGVVLAGASYNYQTANGLEHDGYIIKLDSLGNFVTGINHQTAPQLHDVIIYPNPAHDVIHIRSTINFAATEITLYDSQARKVIKSPLTPKGGNSISIENLGAGIYFYEITDAKGKAERGKLVKE